eukprot:748475-Prorocentrum_minimum.AAC.2
MPRLHPSDSLPVRICLDSTPAIRSLWEYASTPPQRFAPGENMPLTAPLMWRAVRAPPRARPPFLQRSAAPSSARSTPENKSEKGTKTKREAESAGSGC